MDRPTIKEFFPANTTLKDVFQEYERSPCLFNYARALDNFLDFLISELESAEKSKKDIIQAYEKVLESQENELKELRDLSASAVNNAVKPNPEP